MTAAELPAAWRTRAEELRPYAPPAAEAWARAAAELEDALHAAADELLSPTEAAEVSGLSERTLRDHRARGLLEDRGTPGRPRYRRGDLPRRGKADQAGGWDADEHVAGIVGGS